MKQIKIDDLKKPDEFPAVRLLLWSIIGKKTEHTTDSFLCFAGVDRRETADD